jgi:hypothetical protein
MARGKTVPKPRNESVPVVKQRGPSVLAMVLSQRDKLLNDSVKYRAECDLLNKTVAAHVNEKHELVLENNMMRESTMLQLMLMRAEQTEVDNERVRLLEQRGALQELLASLDTSCSGVRRWEM